MQWIAVEYEYEPHFEVFMYNPVNNSVCACVCVCASVCVCVLFVYACASGYLIRYCISSIKSHMQINTCLDYKPGGFEDI